jgi:hypothetical protein
LRNLCSAGCTTFISLLGDISVFCALHWGLRQRWTKAQLAASRGGGPISQVEAQIPGRTFGCRDLELFHRQLQLVTIQSFRLLAELGGSPSLSTAYSSVPRPLSLTFYYYIII